MSSSDSEDDCYSNAALKLKKMKNLYVVNTIQSATLLDDSAELDEIVKNAELAEKPAKKAPKKRGKKAEETPSTSKCAPSEVAAEPTVQKTQTCAKRLTRSSARNSVQEPVVEPSRVPVEPPSTPVEPPSTPVEPPVPAEEPPTPARGRRGNRSSTSQRRTPRGRRRGGRQWMLDSILDIMMGAAAPPGHRGRSPRRGRGRRQGGFPFLDNIEAAMPIYSVGNTYEYPDECHNQELFSNKPAAAKKDDDVVEVDANDSLDDNEELSVKVYWQSSEYFRFNIRRFQKISQIFNYFSKKENVAFGNLLFTLDDKILKPDDTPDSIGYNIGKFIDGGVVNKNVLELVQNEGQGSKGGVKIKFQCQNLKKPFELSVYSDENLSVAMMKCAEHLEQSVDKLRFYFDGDVISGKSTPRELELEGGECIDVKILS